MTRYPVDVVVAAEQVLERLVESDDQVNDVFSQIDWECSARHRIGAVPVAPEVSDLVYELVRQSYNDFIGALQLLQRYPDEDDDGYVVVGEG